MAQFELAQLNIARMLAPLDDPVMAEFVANLDRINALAEQSPGYVWRLKDEDGDATAIRTFGEEYLVNLSVWQNVDALFQFVYRSGHAKIMSRRREWFERLGEAYTVLWWIPAGSIPTLQESKQRLSKLRAAGPSAQAFTFKQPFDARGQPLVIPAQGGRAAQRPG